MLTRRNVIVSSGAATLLSFAEAALVTIDHSNKVYAVNQGESNLCWLASAAMLLSAKRGVPVTMPQLADELGGMWKEMYKSKSYISLDRVEPFAKALKVRTDGFRSLTPDGWVTRVKDGPIILLGYTAEANLGHAVLLAGLSGDTSDFGSMNAKIVDPNGGVKKTESFQALVRFYEGAAPTGVPQLMFV